MALPKSYSEQEKEYIKKRLKEEAGKCLAQFGIRRTTVDEIVKRVKIPKGTFYLFYQSKELLLFNVIQEQHELIEQQMYKTLSNMDPNGDIGKQLTDVVYNFFKLTSDSPILRMLNSDEVEILERKLPQEVLEEHLQHDSSIVEQVLSLFPIKEDVDIETVSLAFRAIYFASLHREEIGDRYFDSVLYLLIRGLVYQLI